MANIKWFTNAFDPIDGKKEVQVVGINDFESYREYLVTNARANNTSFKLLKKYLGETYFSIRHIDGTTDLAVKVSKIKMPKKPYPLAPYVEKNYSTLKENKQLFLGIARFGEELFDLNNIVHLGIFGSSGFGKSNFIRSLLTQNLIINQDACNIILDFKGNEFKSFDNLNHPNILAHVTGMDQMKHFFDFLALEMARREYYFTHGFKIAPTSLKEYNQFKEEYKADHLPVFKKIFIWIDEGKGFSSCCSNFQYDMDKIIAKTRSFGISFIMSSQQVYDFGRFNRNLSHVMTFHTPEYDTGWYADLHHSTIRKMDNIDIHTDQPTKGRMKFLDVENETIKNIQVPLTDNFECLNLIEKYSNKDLKKELMIEPIEIDPRLYGDLNCLEYYLQDNTYANFLNYDFLKSVRLIVRDDYISFETLRHTDQKDISRKVICAKNPFNRYFKPIDVTIDIKMGQSISDDKKEVIEKNVDDNLDFFKDLDEGTSEVKIKDDDVEQIISTEAINEIRERLKRNILG